MPKIDILAMLAGFGTLGVLMFLLFTAVIFALRCYDNAGGMTKWWGLPVWMAGLFGVVVPGLLLCLVAAYWVGSYVYNLA